MKTILHEMAQRIQFFFHLAFCWFCHWNTVSFVSRLYRRCDSHNRHRNRTGAKGTMWRMETFYSTPCAHQHFCWVCILRFLSMPLFYYVNAAAVGPQTYLQIVLTVYFKKEKEKTKRNSFILRLVRSHAAKTAAAAVIHMCRASIHLFFVSVFFICCSVD